MKRFTVITLTLAAMLFSTVDVQAGPWKRQGRQQARIGQGLVSGQLTGREALRLEHQEKHIASDIRAAKADGTVTAAERAKINREQNRESRRIFRQKHDAQTR